MTHALARHEKVASLELVEYFQELLQEPQHLGSKFVVVRDVRYTLRKPGLRGFLVRTSMSGMWRPLTPTGCSTHTTFARLVHANGLL